MRGRPNGLLPLEAGILTTAVALRAEGRPEFHGFFVAARMKESSGAPLFAARGALYKALDRLEKRGCVQSRWEDAEIAHAEDRPPRRLYRVTAAGEAALREFDSSARAVVAGQVVAT